MVRKIFPYLVLGIISLNCYSQRLKTVEGEYTYVVPENYDLDRAKQVALERLKIQLIADEYGTVISQANTTSIKNISGKSDIDFVSYSESEVRGEWVETIGSPVFSTDIHTNQLVVKVSIKGKIREISASKINFKALALRNGTDDKYADDAFHDGDDLYLSFISPVDGYVTVYLIDNTGTAFCLLPYENQTTGNVAIKANTRYVFFSEDYATPDLLPYLNTYYTTCENSQEINQIYVIFSPNPFVKAADSKSSNLLTKDLPRELSNVDFQKWLSTNRTKDKQMTYKRIDITVQK